MNDEGLGLFPMCVSHELKDLSDIPHRDIPGTDLAIVAGHGRDVVKSVAVDGTSLSEAEILATVESEWPSFSLDSMVSLLGLGGEYEDEGPELYVLGVADRLYGASVLGYPEELKRVKLQLGEGFYILPSSVHEVILLADSRAAGIDPAELQQTVSEINQQQVRENERLSNSVYHFDGEKLTAVAGPAAKKEDANDNE